MASVIKRPIVTEKFTQLQESQNQYAFEVDRNATKSDIKAEIEKLYPTVKVTRVNTMIMPSKPKGRFTKGGYLRGRSSVWKKAIVTLKEGTEIDLFEDI